MENTFKIDPPCEGKSWLELAIEIQEVDNDYDCSWTTEEMGNPSSKRLVFAAKAHEIRSNALRELLPLLPKTKDQARKCGFEIITYPPTPRPIDALVHHLIKVLPYAQREFILKSE